jgi:hypothetical protein
MNHPPSAFAPLEIAVAAALAAVIQGAFFVLLIVAGAADARVKAEDELLPKETPIAVKPVLDEIPLPLLKLGGKKMKPKLPEMWKKLPPIPIERFEEKSAPSEDAKDDPESIPTSDLAKGDAEAPPPDAEIAKEVDEHIEAGPPPDAQVVAEGEGAADGVKEGTETDPLKARAVSLYQAKILAWFNARFRPPVGQVPCDELKKLSAAVTASVGGDRTVSGFSVVRPSGNAVFDAKVQATMAGIVGQQLPPPPQNYPDLQIGSSVGPIFSGAGAKCE